ncbi:MAG: hypothetical protein HYY55_02445 [Candidatus Niyogibacteria bacterium]|nr:MAG: hypothetical protein HYY55_02445 [Candidatus Niyogibacteria bacterium]
MVTGLGSWLVTFVVLSVMFNLSLSTVLWVVVGTGICALIFGSFLDQQKNNDQGNDDEDKKKKDSAA